MGGSSRKAARISYAAKRGRQQYQTADQSGDQYQTADQQDHGGKRARQYQTADEYQSDEDPAEQAAPPENHAPAQCAICMDPIVPGTQRVPECLRHAFHPECLARWRRSNPTCPTCRAPIPAVQGQAAEAVAAADALNAAPAAGLHAFDEARRNAESREAFRRRLVREAPDEATLDRRLRILDEVPSMDSIRPTGYGSARRVAFVVWAARVQAHLGLDVDEFVEDDNDYAEWSNLMGVAIVREEPLIVPPNSEIMRAHLAQLTQLAEGVGDFVRAIS